MKVKHKWHVIDETRDYALEELLLGEAEAPGQLESLESSVRAMAQVVCRLVDRLPLADQEKLTLLGLDNAYIPAAPGGGGASLPGG